MADLYAAARKRYPEAVGNLEAAGNIAELSLLAGPGKKGLGFSKVP